MVEFSGHYLHEKDDNFQELLAELGVSSVLRKAMSGARPSLEIKAGEGDGAPWTISISTPVNAIHYNFVLGQETEIDMMGGSKAKVVFSIDGSTLRQLPVDPSGDKAVEVVREFTDDGLIQTITHLASGTKGTRFFKRDPSS